MRGDRRKTSIEWPADVDDRLRHLVQLAEETAQLRTTSASELLAALVCAQPLDGPRLAATITDYRQARRGTMETAPPGGPIVPRPPRRGRPRRNWIKNYSRADATAQNAPTEPSGSQERTSGQGEPEGR